MMMMMILIAGFVDSITTPIRCWLDDQDHHNPANITVKELNLDCSRVDCIVCLSEVRLGESFAMLERCGHGYHVECVEAWLKDHPNCPLCRTPVSVSYEDTQKQSVYLKKFYDMVSCYGIRALETIVSCLTNSFSQGLQSSLSESCSYL